MYATGETPAFITRSGYVALALLILVPVSILMVRFGMWAVGLGLYALTCLASTLMLIVFIVLLMRPKFARFRVDIFKWGLCAIPGTLALLSFTLGANNVYPAIHDITTDTADPPLFIEAQRLRGEDSNSLAIKPDVIELQKRAYADLDSIYTQLGVAEAFEKALATAEAMGWGVYNVDADAGIIEAVDTTKVMAFKDDVVIRLRSDAKGTYIDLRSVSRVGRGDLGANAQRIRAYQEAFHNPQQ